MSGEKEKAKLIKGTETTGSAEDSLERYNYKAELCQTWGMSPKWERESPKESGKSHSSSQQPQLDMLVFSV